MRGVGAPTFDFFAQTFLFVAELLEFTLEALSDWAKGYGFDEFLFAGENVLLDDFGVTRTRPQLEETLEMINGGGVILLLPFVKEAGFEMSQSRPGIGFERFFKTIDRAFIVERVDAAFSSQKVRIFFFIQLAVGRGKAAGKSQAEDQEQRAANQSNQERHGEHSRRALRQSSTFC